MHTTAFITHRECQLHDMGSFHPESPERLTAIADHLIAQGIEPYLSHYEAPYASDEQLLRVHPQTYIDQVKAASPHAGINHLDPDTAMNPFTLKAALRAAGAGVLAVDLVMRREVKNAFCSVRPPGHHAEHDKAMGFCFFANLAIAAHHAIAEHGLARVALIDFDVHHGNGSEDICQNDPRFLMCSIFQHPFYPYCGTESPAANMCNIPLKAGSGSLEFRDAVSNHWLPRLVDFAPQLICISAGFDSHYEDDMGGLKLREPDYAWVTEELRRLADKTANGRIVSMLEGGYVMTSLARSVAAHLRALADI